jgi:hypothetical protein
MEYENAKSVIQMLLRQFERNEITVINADTGEVYDSCYDGYYHRLISWERAYWPSRATVVVGN